MKYIEPKIEITIFEKEDIVTKISLEEDIIGYNENDTQDAFNP